MRSAFILTLIGTACGTADIADGSIRCGISGECPPGFGCRSDGYCYRAATSTDGGIPDANLSPDGPPDAPPDAPVDAPPVACTSDAECNSLDTMCGDWYCDLGTNTCRGNPVSQGVTCMPRSCPNPWSACVGDGTCNQNGTQSRVCSDFTCQGIYCSASNVVESGACPVATDGNTCGADFCNNYPGGCPDGFSDECDESGTRSRNCYARRCSGGGCIDVFSHAETEGCSRSTGGNVCGAGDTCGGWDGSCDDCVESRGCTDRRCGGGTCNPNNRTETRNCGDGITCAPTDCPPGFDGSCNDCEEARTCTDYTCGGGACNPSPRVETRSCADGSYCGDLFCGGGCSIGMCCGGGACYPEACFPSNNCVDICSPCPFPPCPF